MRRQLLFRELIYPLKTREWSMRFWFTQQEHSLELSDLENALGRVRADVDALPPTADVLEDIESVVLERLSEYYCGENLTALEILSNGTRRGIVSYFEW